MSQSHFIWYSLSISAAVFLISIPITFFPEINSVLIEYMNVLGFFAFFVSLIIKRGSFTDFGSEPIDLKGLIRFILLLGIVALGIIAGGCFQLLSTPIGRFSMFVLFIVLWILLLKNACKNIKQSMPNNTIKSFAARIYES